MKRNTHIRPELRDWILTTTRAGHSTDDVLRLMKETGYDPRESRVHRRQRAQAAAGRADRREPRPDGLRPRHPEPPVVEVDGHPSASRCSVESPTMRVLEHLLDDSECDALIALARPRLDRALTVDADGKQQVDHRRTSEGMFFRQGETPLIERIEARLAALLGDAGRAMAKACRCCTTGPAQAYEPHFDWFDPRAPGFEAVTALGGQRVASVVMYLNTPEAGGGTGFPEIGLTVTARKGSAVYFAYEGGDQSSLHAGLPVTAGRKMDRHQVAAGAAVPRIVTAECCVATAVDVS